MWGGFIISCIEYSLARVLIIKKKPKKQDPKYLRVNPPLFFWDNIEIANLTISRVLKHYCDQSDAWVYTI